MNQADWKTILRLDKGMFHKPMLETEIGFVIGRSINKPLRHAKELRKYIKFIKPVIEIPELAFANMK